MLSPYRILDLADDKGLLCGKMLGDLGADVIKVERPGGDPARRIGPFYRDEPDAEASLFWAAYCTNTRGVTLDLETADGKAVFERLVKTADVVVESFAPGYMDGIGLGYGALEELKPGIILVSISPYGQAGPYHRFETADIVAWAMGGYMYSVGDADRAPVRISQHSQTFLHAGGQAAQAALLALWGRETTGLGQHIDVSIRDSVARCTPERVTEAWDFRKVNVKRGGLGAALRVKRVWPCKDGYVSAFFWSGPDARRWNTPLINWMKDEGKADDALVNFDWENFDLQKTDQAAYDRMAGPVARFFLDHTKAELLEGAARYKAQLYPVATAADILTNPQLASRDYWVELEHEEPGKTITYPGSFAKATEAAPAPRRRAPLVGEHNIEIFERELGMSRAQHIMLKQAGVI
jgi:crotonobetainyl-CoA:carnitine CoA-transferase CaiB-like acyl-CoA transferase